MPWGPIDHLDAAATAVGRGLVRWGALIAAGIGALTLVAWVTGPEVVVRVRDAWSVTTPVTATALLLAGTAVELRRRDDVHAHRVARMIGGLTASIGAAVVVIHLVPAFALQLPTGWLPNLGAWQPDVAQPALPPLLTGLIVVAVGQALVLDHVGGRRTRRVSHLVAFASWVGLGVELLGYLGAETGGLRWSAPPDVSLPAAVGFALLWIPLANLTVGAGLTARFGRSPSARLLLRRVGPMLVLVPLLLRGVGKLAEALRAEPTTAAALADMTVIVLLAAALVAVGRTIDGSHEERVRANAMLTGVLGAMHEGLIVRDADGRVVVANPAADEMVGVRFADDPDHAAMIAAGDLRDEGGMPLTTTELPSTQVQLTGSAVLGRVVRIGGDDAPLWVRTNCVPFEDAAGRIGTISTFGDITLDHELATALAQAEERFRLAFEQAPIGIAVVHPGGRFEDVNPALCALLARPREELLGTRVRDLTHPDDLDTPRPELGALLAGRLDSYAMDERYLLPSGEEVWVNLHVSALRDHAGGIERFLVQVVDLTERKALEGQLSHAASHDPLTGLPNRRLVEDRLAVALAASRRDAGTVAVLFCDLDGFKAVNDTHGHRIGDLLLATVAERLRGLARGSDTVGRIGGDEFVVVAGTITDPEDAEQLVGRVRRTIERPVELAGVTLWPRVSVGLHLADGYDTTEEALGLADRRMYEAKTHRQAAVGAVPR